jgi:hypothetical protein
MNFSFETVAVVDRPPKVEILRRAADSRAERTNQIASLSRPSEMVTVEGMDCLWTI